MTDKVARGQESVRIIHERTCIQKEVRGSGTDKLAETERDPDPTAIGGRAPRRRNRGNRIGHSMIIPLWTDQQNPEAIPVLPLREIANLKEHVTTVGNERLG